MSSAALGSMSHTPCCKCRRQILFSEQTIRWRELLLYSHSQKECTTHADCHSELAVLVDAIDTIGDKGEAKLAQWI